jgi:AraC-like DNA-binding protein
VQSSFAFLGLSISFVFLLVSISSITKATNTKIISYWLLALSFVACVQYIDFLYVSLSLYYGWSILYCLVDAIAVLLPLCAYGYMQALQGRNVFANKKYILGHFTPSFIILIVDSHLWLNPIKQQFYSNTVSIETNITWVPSSPNGNIYWGLIAIFSLFYWWRQDRHGYQSEDIQWVKFIQVLLLMNVLSVAIQIIALEVFEFYIPMVYAQGPFAVYFIYTVLSFSPFSQINPQQKQAEPVIHLDNTGKVETNIKEKSISRLTVVELDGYNDMFKELEAHLKNGAYQDNELSLGSLAESCNLTKHQASIAINHFSGSNFYEWVRQHRIAASKEILEKTNLTVSTIYYDVGFNSKSSFYTAFKKIMGCTPTEYRDLYNENIEE